VAGQHVAPPWFGPAMKTALDPVRADIFNLEVFIHNRFITDRTAAIRAKKNARGETRPDFPATIEDLSGLSHAGLEGILEFYELPVAPGMTQAARSQKLADINELLGLRE
jgi:hypothetical protein